MMPRRFLITGLPRSRTAWMAAFFSSGDVFCHHELIKHNQSAASYIDAMAYGYRAIGNSDCGAMLFPEIVELHDAVVVIERDPDEVISSLSRIYPDHAAKIPPMIDWLKSGLDGIDDALRVPYNSINDHISEIWEYCCLYGFDENRFDLMRDLRIETTNI